MFYVFFPEDREFTPSETRSKAESFARECAADGCYCEVLSCLRSFEAQPVDMCRHNGITPGVDCPAFV